ncbi:glucosylceramidase precursor [Tritrichomonas foetus]|uniref:Glucosylceramidase n=1 Tax=Tritrichomonas foetus TaxID=1144522 RepID=A0A1J4KP68_9EUKA|nr:glucosylceramidase precursor [Tritrichomonas foetus]|eukprot:OHT13027.1 glucosylceramidase precursor [Tritrichomonas foetus]
MLSLLLTFASCWFGKKPKNHDHTMQAYLTSGDQSNLFREYSISPSSSSSNPTIKIDAKTKYQSMEGFGTAITGSTVYNLMQMSEDVRNDILYRTFSQDQMGHSSIRISIGCSDFSIEDYTYCDTPGIENFDIHWIDRRDLLPILKQIKSINPDIKILASPWTAPRWMKVDAPWTMNEHYQWDGGRLNPNHYYDYAIYFVKYCQFMANEGIHIDYITIQNEPLNGFNSASLYMSWWECRDFIKQQLGPRFREYGVDTKIVIYDHNFNYDGKSEEDAYPLHIYEDKEAAQYIDGSAWHAYGGEASELDRIHNARPDKNIYFTEMSIGDWGYEFLSDLMWTMREVCLGTINRFSRSIIVWNLLLDDEHGPYRPGGCTNCFGAIDVSKSNMSDMKYNTHWYAISHLSKCVKNGAFRVRNEIGDQSGFYSSVFQNPDGSFALVAENDNDWGMDIVVDDGSQQYQINIPSHSVFSSRWH